MEPSASKNHWDTIYTTKQPHEVSWTQAIPQTSLDAIAQAKLPKEAAIIDVGGGDSLLVDFLLDAGYQNITVLDISAEALLRAQKRLGARATTVHWIVTNILDFQPPQRYDLWHDRAAFHFLTSPDDIATYQSLAIQALKPQGHLIVGTFSEEGPLKCSGLEITQYSNTTLTALFSPHFETINSLTIDHTTPFNTVQNFVFCHFKKK
jgi:2-polyprenyl-3-methyl-5-hydroxy-6-metoxy-1,4-benzoquinol methylase